MLAGSTDPEAAASPPWLVFAGPASTVLFLVALHLFQGTPVAAPNPGVILSLSVVLSAFLSGIVPGLVSAILALAYATWFYSTHSWPLAFSQDHLRALPAIYLSLPALAVLVGLLQSRARAAQSHAADAAAAAKYQEMFERAGDAIFLADSGGRYHSVNQCACDMTGYSEAELLRMCMSDVLAPGELERQPLRVPELNGSNTVRVERVFRRKDGSTFVGETSASMTPGGHLLGIVRDATVQHEAMRKLREVLSLQQATLESTTDGILVVDMNGRWAGYNQRFLEMWGVTPDVIRSGDDARALAAVGEQLQDPAAFLAKVEELYASPLASSFDEVVFRDGRMFERYSLPQLLDGRAVGRVWSFRDVTQQRRQAVALLESERRWQQTQKLEALGRLAGGVAHDFNNMLLAILGEAELLEMALPQDSPHRDGVANIRSAGQRSAALTRQLLAFGRLQPLEPSELGLRALLQELEPLMRRIVAVRVRLVLELGEGTRMAGHAGDLRVLADSGQLEQAVLNLVINASDAMPDGGDLYVRLGADHVAPEQAAARGARQAGLHAVIEVSDTGTGIDPGVRSRLFEPFFTTKDAGKGTGLGLSTVYSAVERAGGFLEVDSAPGVGSAFRILLPAVLTPRPHAAPSGAAAEAAPSDPIRATILVAEDEALVRQFVGLSLRHMGCHVLEAESGEHALALSASYEGKIDLLLSDVIMPGLTGPEVAKVLLAQRPGLRVLLMSGYSGDDGLPHVREGEREWLLLTKPFTGATLAGRLRELLASPV